MQKWLVPFIFIWRVWFYVSILLAILLLFPFIFITSLTSKWYRSFFFFARVWAWMVLLLSGLIPKVKWQQKPSATGQYIIAPNHSSLADIMITLAIFPNCFLFIGKKELAKMPLFGYFYKRTNLLVDRKSMRSRIEVFDRASEKIKEGFGVCVYPEGMVPRDEATTLADFKNGAFKLAAENNIPIIPVSIFDGKRRLPFSWVRGCPGTIRVTVHPFLEPSEMSIPIQESLKIKCYTTIFDALSSDDKYMRPTI